MYTLCEHIYHFLIAVNQQPAICNQYSLMKNNGEKKTNSVAVLEQECATVVPLSSL